MNNNENQKDYYLDEIDLSLIDQNPIKALVIATTKIGWSFEEANKELFKRYEELYKLGKTSVSPENFWKHYYS